VNKSLIFLLNGASVNQYSGPPGNRRAAAPLPHPIIFEETARRAAARTRCGRVRSRFAV